MTVYSVHVPSFGKDPQEVADRVHFERQGFAFWAFVFGPFWLLWRRLWRALLIWCALAAAVMVAAQQNYVSAGAIPWLVFFSALYLGLEGHGVAAAAFDRGDWRLADVAIGANQASAERSFFARWSAAEAPLAARKAPSGPPPLDVLGLFPEAGG
jgi:hypothetical protein